LPLDAGIGSASGAFFGPDPYRVAADVLKQVFPINAGKDPETVPRHTLKIGATLRGDAVARPEMAAAAVAVTLDSTFIRCEDGERHLEVRVSNVETETGGRQVFGAVVWLARGLSRFRSS
jgi:hypothetical protein